MKRWMKRLGLVALGAWIGMHVGAWVIKSEYARGLLAPEPEVDLLRPPVVVGIDWPTFAQQYVDGDLPTIETIFHDITGLDLPCEVVEEKPIGEMVYDGVGWREGPDYHAQEPQLLRPLLHIVKDDGTQGTMWSGAEPPEGWHVMTDEDIAKGAPDLRTDR